MAKTSKNNPTELYNKNELYVEGSVLFPFIKCNTPIEWHNTHVLD